ncbi:calcium-binding and coiled-coil domain-containing protein 2 [Pocillopora verrucosa]|uniref:calcium-binding and coiled-coil domain-containing protein 2 n=1 Tax=Pocillopora verrucosa TaxID=203993 RepID=UPI0033418175
MDSPNCDGSRSYESIYSRSGQFPRDREVHHNAAYDPTHDYEELQSVGVESKEKGPRRKDNDLYEPTGPLKQRVRQITECSDDLSALSVCSASGLPSWKKDSCLSKLILFLILAFSVAALVLVILIINGTLGPKCGCKDFNTGTKPDTPRPEMQSSVQSLLSRIEALENEMSTMKSKMEAKDNALKNFVTRHESQVEVLQAQVNKTATKVATVDGVWVKMRSSHEAFEKKLDSEFKQLNESVKKLNNQDTRISSDVEELRKNQVITKRMSGRLAINVTDVESSVRELKKTDENISSRVASLKRGYTRMNNTMRTLQAIDTAQNASRQRLHSLHKRLRASLTAVNATLNDKIKKMDAISDKQQGVNFSLCEHKTVSSTKVSADRTSGESDAFYYFSQDKRVMGVTCATNNARFYTLSEFTSNRGKGFKCKCEQLSPVFYKELNGKKQVSMQCHLHVWECPI